MSGRRFRIAAAAAALLLTALALPGPVAADTCACGPVDAWGRLHVD